MAVVARWAIPLCLLCLVGPAAHADGGTVRASERRGPFQVTVFTSPTPPRAGMLDVSVLVQDSAQQPLRDGVIRIAAWPMGQPGDAILREATTEEATNKLFRAAILDLPTPGQWVFEVTIEAREPVPPVRFSLDLEAPLPGWYAWAGWVAWPAAAVGLFIAHRYLVSRRKPLPRRT